MNKQEKLAIKELPPKYRPLGAWKHFWYAFLWCLPIIGQISWIVCAVASKNICVRSFARSYLVAIFMMILVVGVILLADTFLLGGQIMATLTGAAA